MESRAQSRVRDLLEMHFDLICCKLSRLATFSGLSEPAAEELCSWVLFKLAENDYRILAGWTGRSSFETYLTVVLVSLARDYRSGGSDPVDRRARSLSV